MRKPTPTPINPGPITWDPECQNLLFLGEQGREQDQTNPVEGPQSGGQESGEPGSGLS